MTGHLVAGTVSPRRLDGSPSLPVLSSPLHQVQRQTGIWAWPLLPAWPSASPLSPEELGPVHYSG